MLHTLIVITVMAVAELLFAFEPESPAYYLFGATMLLTVVVTIGYLWVRRAKLSSEMESSAAHDRG